MAGTGLPRGSPPTDFGQQDHRVESQLPGAASYSHWRPEAVADRQPVERPLQTGCSQSDFAGECWQRQKAVIQAPLRWPTALHINLPFIPNFAADRRRGQDMQAQ